VAILLRRPSAVVLAVSAEIAEALVVIAVFCYCICSCCVVSAVIAAFVIAVF
jgi:hypothetical protein